MRSSLQYRKTAYIRAIYFWHCKQYQLLLRTQTLQIPQQSKIRRNRSFTSQINLSIIQIISRYQSFVYNFQQIKHSIIIKKKFQWKLIQQILKQLIRQIKNKSGLFYILLRWMYTFVPLSNSPLKYKWPVWYYTSPTY